MQYAEWLSQRHSPCLEGSGRDWKELEGAGYAKGGAECLRNFKKRKGGYF